MNSNQNYFELFALPSRFAVDTVTLDSRYRELQREYHPDRFATAGEAEKRLSVQRATWLNEAYRTLKSPLARARYLLELAGVDVGLETSTDMPADFLMQQMEWREALEEAGDSGVPARLDELDRHVRGQMTDLYASIESALDAGETADASDTLRKLMFLEKLRGDIGAACERMESEE